MKQKDLVKNLHKAEDGDADAIAALAEYLSSARVFVRRDGEVDVDATLEAIVYWRTEGVEPATWDDLPTCSLRTAFRSKVQLDPIRLNPVTPGTWKKLWERQDGHRIIAAVFYGRMEGDLTGSGLELAAKAKAYLLEDGVWPELEQILAKMDGDPEGAEAAMSAVTMRRSHAATRTSSQTVVGSVGVAQASGGGSASVTTPPRGPFGQRGQSVNVTASEGGISVGGDVRGNIATPPPSKYHINLRGPSQGVVIGDHAEVVFGHRSLNEHSLKDFIAEHYELEELKTLCFALATAYGDNSVGYDSLPSEGLAAKARELVLWHTRRKRLDHLVATIKQDRMVAWVKTFGHQ